ncbi:hypothetical protein BpHYR1_046455 [Brachionus plicatilis]|uniref:Uncharacterized protein n=1 Tax=Brachionus plicatilis TaxID=10195 RepID=A0A3M7QQ46_BRAPC|nr:hypothetical protein BpHYR1_046455 [Brachionus plicatilis]
MDIKRSIILMLIDNEPFLDITCLSVDIDTSLDEPDKPLYKKQKKNFTKAEEFLLQFIVSAALPAGYSIWDRLK